MHTGQFDRRVRIEREVVTRDPAFNSQVKTWVEVATVWADVQDVLPSRAESVQQGVDIAGRPSRVRMRYRAGITPDMRVVILGREERIAQIVAGPAEIGRREAIELMVTRYSV
jgi:SPP1 family predicted phage head-tail adaptor